MENSFKNRLYKLFKKDVRLWDEEGKELNETLLKDLIDNLDEKIVELLLRRQGNKGEVFYKNKRSFCFKNKRPKIFYR